MMLHRHFEAAREQGQTPPPAAPADGLIQAVDVSEGEDLAEATAAKQPAKTAKKRK